MAGNSAVHSQIWSNFEVVQDFIVVLVTFKNEEDPLKNEGARVFTTLYSNFSDAQGQITLELVVVSGLNLNSSKLSCMSFIPVRMSMIESKMKELGCSQDFSHYKSICGLFQTPKGSLLRSPIWPYLKLVRDVIDVLVTCKYEEDPIKMKALECSQHFPHYIPMGAIGCNGHQSSDLIWSKT